MRDQNLRFNTNAQVIASTHSDIVDVGKSGALGLWVELACIGGSSGTAQELLARVQYSDSATFASGIEDGPDLVIQQGNPGFRVAKLCQSYRRYWRVQYALSGTSPSFTGLYAGIVTGPQRDNVSG